MVNIEESLSSDISSFILKKLEAAVKSNSLYETATKNITVPESFRPDIKKIVEESFHEAAKIEILQNVPQAEFRNAVYANQDIFYVWALQEPMPAFDAQKLEITNYDYEKALLTFFKSLYAQFLVKRDFYPSLSNSHIKQILQSISVVNNDTNAMVHDNHRMLLQIQENQGINEHWSFSEELSEIESKISNRQLTSARTSLATLECKILLKNKKEEKEKFYELYTNAYLVDAKNQKQSILYLEKLISCTEKPIQKKQREILLLVLNGSYDKALVQIKVMLAQNLPIKDRQYFLELAVNVYLLTNQFTEAQEFLYSIKTEFEKYLLWQVRILITQSLYAEAANIVEKNDDFFTASYDKKVIKIETLCYAATEEYNRNGLVDEQQKKIERLIPECDALLDDAADNIEAKETLLVCNGFFYRMLHNLDKSLEAYTELERINSNNPNFLRNYPLALLLKPDSTNRKKAIIYFKKYLDLFPRDPLIRESYFQALVQDNLKQAIDEIERFDEDKTTVNAKLQLAEAYIKDLNLSKADSFISAMDSKYPGHWAILTARGDYFYAKQEVEKVLWFYREALKKCPDMIHRFDLINKIVSIDLTVQNHTNVDECIELFNSIQNEYERLITFGHKYIYALIAGQDISYAVQQIKKMREYNMVTPDIIRDEIWCNYSYQNYQSVIELINELKRYEPLNKKDVLEYVISKLSLGKTEESSAAFDLLPEPETEQDFLTKQKLAHNIGDKSKEMEIIHRGYLKYPDSIPLMGNFITAFLFNGDKLPENIYMDAMECINKYFKLDENKRLIKTISIPENASNSQFLESINKLSPPHQPVDYIKILKENHLHISFLTIYKFNYLYLWESSRYLPDMHIYSSNGNFEAIRKECGAAKTDKAIIDLPSLVTCAYLGVLDYLPKLFSTIYISQQALSELQEVIQTKTDPLLPNCNSCFYSLNENKDPEKPVPVQEEIVNLAQTLKNFIDNDSVKIVGRQLEPVKQLPAEWEKDFQSYSFIEKETIRYGYESNIPIMLESSLHRALLQSDRNAPPVFEIESVLGRLVHEKKIIEIRYILCVCKLMQIDYRAITFNFRFLFALVKYYGFTDSEYANKIFSLLEDAGVYNKDWAVETILMPFLALLWNTYIPETPKIFWTEKTFSALAKRGDVSFSDVHVYISALYKFITMYQSKEWLRKYWDTNRSKIKAEFEPVESENDNTDNV